MKKIYSLLAFVFAAVMAPAVHALVINPAPGPEIGEGSIGLFALGISAVAYVAYQFKNKK